MATGFAPLEVLPPPELTIPVEDAITQFNFEVCFRCVQVRKLDVFSESDPYIVITDVETSKELWRSEVEMDDPNPNFLSKWRSPSMTPDQMKRQLRFDVFDLDVGVDDFVGTYTASLIELVTFMRQKYRMDLVNSKATGFNGGLFAYVDPVFDSRNFGLSIGASVSGAGSKKVFLRLCRGSWDIYTTPVHTWAGSKGSKVQFEPYETSFVDLLLGEPKRLFSIEVYEGSGWKPGKCTLVGSTQASLSSIGSAGSGSNVTWYKEKCNARVSVNYSATVQPDSIKLAFDIALQN
mmetsp:Transcript_16458/g.35740  ORF Transcript_16458/g.35740 Transcript_16458/m.35740 type:complete len:292 (+) Transcript_16458:86-961(+)|eukprot:CAMPEP_0185844024 /NCGR_PEP_ID=MMETSP1354-20130828/345_1 /TAXON_ID=708628 /ORGANISM="Erythrolobus madagascarensis, Strain CCMP3276" /LENGTH=291 /DNA_ID=CAMNT_0028543631 /DNA_START=80 /DNA_END=955 /DNA_ORIENTATION=-